jgi:hypothetical protein
MGLLEKLQAQAGTPKGRIEAKITAELNKLFYLPKKPEEESAFIRHVLTRGTGEARHGLHASDILSQYSDYSAQEAHAKLQGTHTSEEAHNVHTMRIFEHGNATHEKWQRLFVRGGMVDDIESLDSTITHSTGIQYSPDAIVNMPNVKALYDEPFVVEIKSQTTYLFKQNKPHEKAIEQLQFYLWLHNAKHGFVLAEDKNTQEFSVEYVTSDALTKPIAHLIERVGRLMDEQSG